MGEGRQNPPLLATRQTLLNHGGKLQPQPGAVGDPNGRVRVPHDMNQP